MLALLLALEALPENTAEPERPVVDSAVAALYSALISGSGDNSYESVTELTIPGLTSWRSDGSTLMFFSPEQEGYIGSVNLFTGELAETSSALDELPVDVCFSFGLTPYAIYDREVMFNPGGYYSNGEYRSLGELPERDFVKSPWLGVEASDGSICFYNENYGVLQCAGYLSLYCTYESDAAYFEDMKPVNGSDEEYLIATGAESPHPQIIRVDAGVTWAESVLSRYYVDLSMADSRIKGLSGYISDIGMSKNGDIIAGYNESCIFFWNAADGGLRVYDANSAELLAELVPSFFSEWTTESGEQPDSPKLAVSEISFSEDESKMLVCCTRSSIGTDEQRALCVYDTDTLREP